MGDINQSDLIKLLQRTGGESPDSFSISTEGGKCEEFFVIGGEYLDSWLADFVGFTQAYTTANPGDPRTGLARNLPIANGRRPYLFADSISSVKGIQYLSAEDWEYKNLKVPLANNNARLNVLNFPVYSSYREYEVGVTYSPRPYVLTNDEYIVWKSQQVADPANWDTDSDVTYYLPSYDGANNKFVTYTDIMPEWLRYTIHKKSPRAEFLTIDQGQGFLWNKGGANPLLPAGTGQVKNLYSSADVVITWMQVPYVFVDGDSTTEFKSMFDYALGTVNSYLFLGYNPGTLLFQAVNITNIYSQAFPPTSYLYDDSLSKPNYYYIGEVLGRERKHRFNYTKQKLLEKFKGDSLKTEEQLANENGLYRIFDCGHMRFSIIL